MSYNGKKKSSDIVYVPAIGTQDIKQEIIKKENPQYEAQSVKYQGFYKDPYTGELKTQTLRHIDGFFVSTGAGSYTATYTIRKRFVVTHVTIIKQVTAGAIAVGEVYISDDRLRIRWRHNGTQAYDKAHTFDFSSCPLVLSAADNTITIAATALPTANDTIYYHIAGWEED